MTSSLARIVLDTNVFVSAVISPSGTTGLLVRAAFDGRYRLVVCPALLTELDRVLHRPSFRQFLESSEVTEFIDSVEAIADVEPDPREVVIVSRDPDDDYLLALAEANNADLVSGDADLHAVAHPTVTVVSPRELLDRLANGRQR